MEALWQDLRFGVRILRRDPLATAIALVILALGIGANTAIWSAVDAVLVQPLPFPHPERLMAVVDHAPRHGFPRLESSAPNYRDWREENRTFASLDAYYAGEHPVLSGGGFRSPAAVPGAHVTGGLFRTLGAAAAAGRLLEPDDDRPGSEPAVVLSHDLWRARFGGDRGIVGRRLQVDGVSRTIVGVAAPGFRFPQESALWVPFAVDYARERRGAHNLTVVGRLAPGATRDAAEADLGAIAARLAHRYPATNDGWGVIVEPLHDLLARPARPALLLLARAVWLVLAIACANVASLLLSRLASRERELAVRAALGAGKARLARQLLAESAVLALAGGALGLLLARLAMPALRALPALAESGVPRAAAAGLDARVLLYALGLSLLTGLAVGLVPVATSSEARLGARQGGTRLYAALKEGSRSIASGGRGRSLRGALVAGEVALALALLVAAGLLLRSFARLQAVRAGFAPDGVMTAALSLPAGRYSEERRGRLWDEAAERARALPGARHAAAVYPLPLSGDAYVQPFWVVGRPRPLPTDEPRAEVFIVTPDYFAALGVPLLAGRDFTARDRPGSLPAVVVNRTLARRIWPGESPLGRRIVFDLAAGLKAREMTVVGVVGDVRSIALREEPMPQAYWPQAQRPLNAATLVVSAARPEALAAPLRRSVGALDRDLLIDELRPLPAVVAASLAASRVQTFLLAGFGALALLLAAAGIYGLVGITVARRTHEIGVRMALGASRGRVLAMVVAQGMSLVAAGIVAGLAAAWAAGRLVADQLFAVSATDPAVYLGAPLLLAAVALAAHWLPARRATRVDPLAALRVE